MTRKLYSVDVAIYATAYIKASSPEEAREKMDDKFMPFGLELSGGCVQSMPYDELMADDNSDLAVTLSPAMTPNHYLNLDFQVVWEPEEQEEEEPEPEISDEQYRAAARAEELHDASFDDDAVVSRGNDDGAYVQAWIWVPSSSARRA